MLTIRRKKGQSFKVGDEVSVEVVSVQGENVTLRVAAPKTTPIIRTELCGTQQECEIRKQCEDAATAPV